MNSLQDHAGLQKQRCAVTDGWGSLRILGSYTRITGPVVYCHVQALKRCRKGELPSLVMGVPSQKRGFQWASQPRRSPFPKMQGWGRALCPQQAQPTPRCPQLCGVLGLGSPREAVCLSVPPSPAGTRSSSTRKSKSHPEGTCVYLNAFPIIPFYGPHILGALSSQETGSN